MLALQERYGDRVQACQNFSLRQVSSTILAVDDRNDLTVNLAVVLQKNVAVKLVI